MPRGDRRGPDGMGPMTGRGLGYCAGYDRPGFQSDAPPAGRGQGWGAGPGWGRGQGFGGGRGRGRGFGPGWGYQPQVAPDFAAPVEPSLADEVVRLRQQLKQLEARLAEQKGDE